MGIAADMHDFGRSMLVCVMLHDEPHHHAAWEWFDYGQTLALLPMNDDPVTGAHRSSVVLTLPSQAMEPILAEDPVAFGHDMTRRFAGRLGTMTLVSTRHAYPLVAVYPRQMVAQRFACVGDAAVGMHPVTAHGLQFRAARALTRWPVAYWRLMLQVRILPLRPCSATSSGRTRRATRPIYLATQLITHLIYQRGTALPVGFVIWPCAQASASPPSSALWRPLSRVHAKNILAIIFYSYSRILVEG